MAYVNENTINQDTESEEEVAAGKALARKNVKARKNVEGKKNAEGRKLIKQEKDFLNIKNFYEDITLLVKLTLNNFISFSKELKYIRECDAEEFFKIKKYRRISKSENEGSKYSNKEESI